MRKPRVLRAGARVALLAPAGPVTAERLQLSVERCLALGLEPVIYDGAHQRTGYLAGPDQRRLGDLQNALDDASIDAVWALRGGFGTTRIMNQLDLTVFAERPRPFIGFSDNTALHTLFAQAGIVSFHGPHPGAAFPAETEAALRSVLFQTEPAGVLPLRSEDPEPRALVRGSVEAPLTGGNLALLAALCGTAATPRAQGHILFLEDVAEPAYRIDRMLVQLRDAGVLQGVAGLALGRFTEVVDANHAEVADLLRQFAESLNVPAVIDFPIGHVAHNWTLPIGVRARLDADAAVLELTEAAVVE